VISPLCDDPDLRRVGEVWREKGGDPGVGRHRNGRLRLPALRRDRRGLEEDDLEGLHEDTAVGLVHEDPDAVVTFPRNHDTAGPGVGPDGSEGRGDGSRERVRPVLLGDAASVSHDDRRDLRDPRIRDLIRVKNDLACGELIDRYPGSQLYVYEREATCWRV
jgi:hypothetical protein